MKSEQTNLSGKIVIVLVAAALMASVFSGCGKSEATKAAERQAVERQNARQKFKEAVAAVKVRTQIVTYSEFRKAELDLETNYEANKAHLDDLNAEFSKLSAFMKATDFCWDYCTKHPELGLERYGISKRSFPEVFAAMQIINPEIISKQHLRTIYETEKEPELRVPNYIHRGLAKVNTQCEIIMNLLFSKK